MNRLIERRVQADATTVVDDERYWYNSAWQLVQVDKMAILESAPDEWYVYKQYVWDLRYIDAPIYRLRDDSPDGEGVTGNRTTHTADWVGELTTPTTPLPWPSQLSDDDWANAWDDLENVWGVPDGDFGGE